MIQVSVVFTEGKVVFEFEQPMGFSTLLVASSREQMMWKVLPLTMQPAEVLNARMFGAPVPSSVMNKVASAVIDEAEDPPVTRVVYGEVPQGYWERAKALPLQPGEKYCVHVVGRGLERGGEYFIGP